MATYDKTGRQIKRGDVYFMTPPSYDDDTVLIEKTRPFVVLYTSPNTVVGLPVTTADKSRYLNRVVRTFDKKNNSWKYILCETPFTIPLTKVDNLVFVMSDAKMREIDSMFAKNMGIVNMDLGFLYDPIVNMVRENLSTNHQQTEKITSVIGECIKLLTDLNNSLGSDIGYDEVAILEDNEEEEEEEEYSRTSTEEKPEYLTPNEVDGLVNASLNKKRYNKFFNDEENIDYIKHYLDGDYEYIFDRYSDSISTMHTRAKYMKDNYDYIKKMFDDHESKSKKTKKFRKYTREQNIDYARHAADKDYEYIKKTFGDDRNAAQKRLYYMKANIEYIKDMF